MRGIQYVMQWTAVKCLRLRTVLQARRGKVAGHKITEYLDDVQNRNHWPTH